MHRRLPSQGAQEAPVIARNQGNSGIADTASFSNRNFLLLAQGSWVNQAGTQISLVATTVWLRSSTNSTAFIGLLVTASALPVLLLSPIGGVLADRWFRRKGLILWDSVSGFVSCALVLAVSSSLPVADIVVAIFAASLLLSCANAFTGPAFNALIPDVVSPGHLQKAMAFTQASGLVAVICGQAVGGLLIGRYPPQVLFGIDAATYFLSAAASFFVHAAPLTPKSASDQHVLKMLWSDIREGIAYVWRRRGMRLLLLSAIPLNIFVTPIFVFLPFYTTNALSQPLSRYGYLLATFSVGLLLGYASASKLPASSSRTSQFVFGCVLANAVICILLSANYSYPLALLLLFVLGACTGIVTLLSLNVLIARTVSGMRGRVSSLLVMIAQGITPASMSLVGVAANGLHGNVRPLYSVCGAVLLVLGSALSANSDLRRFFHEAPEAH